MSVWILLELRDYDSPEIIGAFADEAQAVAVGTALDNATTDYEVVEIPTLGPITVEPVDQAQHCTFGIKWDGSRPYERIDRPDRRVLVLGLPEGDQAAPAPVPLTIERRAFESGYRLGVSLTVEGSGDVAAVLAAYEREKAEILADPAAAVVKAWEGNAYLPAWVWGRPENQGLLAALEAVGFTRIDNGPLGS